MKMTLTPTVRRHTRARLLVAAGVVALLAACSPGGGSESGGSTVDPDQVTTDIADVGDVTLTVWDQEVRGGQDKPLKELNQAFMDKYPNVTIERTSKSFSDLQKQVKLAISGDNPPDVVQANNARGDMGAFVQAGLLRQLDGYADVYGWNDRFPETVRSVSSYTSDGKTFGEGNLYGVPLTGEMVGVWYNKAKLEELGIDPPQTVEDFEAALQTAKDAGEIPIQFGDLDQWPGIHEFGFVQNLFVPPDDIRKLGFGQAGASWESDENKQAADTLVDWVDKGYFTDGFNGLGYDPSWQDFAKGKGVFLISGTWLLADLQDAMGDDLGFMLPPTGATGDQSVTGSTGLPFAITEASRAPGRRRGVPRLHHLAGRDGEVQRRRRAPRLRHRGQSVTGTQAEMFDAWADATGSDKLTALPRLGDTRVHRPRADPGAGPDGWEDVA